MITIKTLSRISIQQIHNAFSKAFADYVEPFDLTCEQLNHMIERRGYNPDLSFGAFNEDELVGFTLNGIGEWNGELTAYDTGTGIIKEYRKQGIATRMFNESLPVLRENKITQYLLEVIKANTGAYELYKKAGFKVTREFDYYISTKDKIEINQNKLNKEFRIQEIKYPDWEELKTFWDFEPSWQNSIDSVKRKMEYFKVIGIFDKSTLAGYGIIEKHTGDIPQLSVAQQYRRKGCGTVLFKHLLDLTYGDKIKIINTDATYEPFKKFVQGINLSPGIGQYEMIMKL
jgi:ribosomal protein S18 acetylase RimI-like enzyme